MVNDEFYISLALQEAWKYQLLTYPNPPVGALIVDKYGKIISIAAHKKQGLAHAELECTKDAFIKLTGDKTLQKIENPNNIHQYLLENHNGIFFDFKIYVTLEPCNHYGSTPPCSLLIANLGFKEVIIGSIEKNKKAMGGIETLQKKDIKIKTGILKKECDKLIEPFLKWQKDRFVFFKIAQNLNGTYDTGIISSKISRELVHKIRDKIDLLVIGGNTVRTDRPTLNSRMVDGKAPDILILSTQKNFDKTIPLFNVPNRKVIISNNLQSIEKYNFIMVEGGNNMLKSIKAMVDWYLFFINPNIKEGNCLNCSISTKIIYQSKCADDVVLWLTNSY